MIQATTSNTRIVVFDNPDFGPSRRMVDMISELAEDRPDIEIEQIDIWQHPDRGVEHDVMTVPTTIFFVDGVEQKRLCGLRSSRSLRRALARVAEREPAQGRRVGVRAATAG